MAPVKNIISNYGIEREIVIDATAKAYLLQVKENKDSINYVIIPEEQKTDIGRYHLQQDRDKRLLTRSFLFDQLKAHHGITDFTLEYDANKKPSLRSAPGIHFSFSYAKEYAFIGVSTGKKLGVNIEYIDTSVPVAELAVEIMNKDEVLRFRSYVGGSAEQYQFFFRLFTAKEAIIKAFGTGLNIDIREISILSGDQFIYGKDHFLYRDEGMLKDEYYLAVCREV